MTNDFDKAVEAATIAARKESYFVPDNVLRAIVNAALPPSAAAEATRELLDQIADRAPAAIQAAVWSAGTEPGTEPAGRLLRPWAPTPDSDGHLTLGSIVRQAIGAGSVCWETMAGTGQFREDIANSVAEGTLVAIHRLLDPRGGS